MAISLVFISCKDSPTDYNGDSDSDTTGGGYFQLVWQGSRSTAPASAEDGWVYFNTGDGKLYVFISGSWQELAINAIPGTPGDKGKDGNTPYIGGNDNWWIGETDTNIPATGPAGSTPYIGGNNNWWIGETDTTIPATGAAGADGTRLVWKDDATEPADPEEGWLYYNTASGQAFIYLNSAWKMFAQDGVNGNNADAPIFRIDTETGEIYVDTGSGETLLGVIKGPKGDPGIPILWQGEYIDLAALIDAKGEPQLNWAYYDITMKQSRIFNGSEWETLTQDGNKGNDGKNSYLVIFNGNGGTPVLDAVGVLHDNTVDKPSPDPVRTCYTFDRWYKDKAGLTQAYVFETETVTANITLYAKWINPNHRWSGWTLKQTGVETRTCSACNDIEYNFLYEVGDIGPGGGIIYYVADGRYGPQYLGFEVEGVTIEGTYAYLSFEPYTAYYLEAAPSNSSDHTQWGDPGTLIDRVTTNTDDNLVLEAGFVGRKDTMLIVAHMESKGIENTAAQLCFAATYGGKDDWFLPGLGELLVYWGSSVTEQKPTSGGYWSSSQSDNRFAWGVNFTAGGITMPRIEKNYGISSIGARAIRAF